MMPHDHQAAPGDHEADELNRFLDALVAGRPSPTNDLPQTFATSVRHVHRFADERVAPRLTSTESDRLWEDLMQTHMVPHALHFPGPCKANPIADTTNRPTATDRHRAARLRLVGSVGTAGTADALPVPMLGARRDRSPRRRWARHGWPIVELLGVAALIIGLVSVIMGGFNGNDGGRPAVIPMAGVGTATPEETSVEVANLPDPGQTGVMPGPGIDGNPDLVWRVPIEDHTADLFVSDGTIIRSHFSSEIPADFPNTTNPWTIEALSARAGTPIWASDIEASSVQIAGIWQETIVLVASTQSGAIRIGDEVLGEPGQGFVVGMDMSSGAVQWSTAVTDDSNVPVTAFSPTLTSGQIFVPTSQGRLYSLDATEGSIDWMATIVDEAATQEAIQSISRPAVDGDVVSVYSNASNAVVALDASTGEQLWTLQVTDPPVLGTPDAGTAGLEVVLEPAASVNGPAIAAGKVFVSIGSYSGDADQSLMAIDLATGTELWTTEVGSIDLTDRNRQYGIGQPYVSDNAVIVSIGGSDGNQLLAVSPETGDQLWKQRLSNGQYSQMSIADETGYVARDDGTLSGIDLQTGDELWSVETGAALHTAPFVVDGMLYQASDDGQLYALGDDGTDSATPGASTDISGLASCDVEPRAAPEDVFAMAADRTPAATLAESVYLDSPSTDFPMPPTLAWDDLPVGSPADTEVATAIQQTVDGITTCTRDGEPAQVAAYYSDDFFSRPYNLNANGAVDGYFTTSEIPVMSGDLRVLDDGRVGMIATEGLISREIGQNQATLYVFAEQPDGQWLIDEVVIVNNSGKAPQG